MRIIQSTLVNGITYDSVRDSFFYVEADGSLIWRKHSKSRNIGKDTSRVNYVAGSPNQYKYIAFLGRPFALHRLIWIYHHGIIGRGLRIDHVDGDTLNNRIENLRMVSALENNRNAARRYDNTSGITGVRYSQSQGKWVAFIYNSGERIELGRYDKKDEAIIARTSAELALGYHKNHGREKILK